jgi:hypothetical protein
MLAASLCRQVAAWVQEMLFNFYEVKIHTNVNNSSTAESKATKKDSNLMNFLICSQQYFIPLHPRMAKLPKWSIFLFGQWGSITH